MKKAIVLLSGGLDSATALALALDAGLECIPIAFDYSQRHRRELVSSASIVQHYFSNDCCIQPLRTVLLGGLDFSTSSLTSSLAVPRGRDEKEMTVSIPPTYVPARNSIFLSIGTAFAEALDADFVYTGFNAIDYSGYPDCRPEYVDAMEKALGLGTKRGVEGNRVTIAAPLISWTKKEIVKCALDRRVPLQYTWSCYVGQDKPCGSCDSCVIRAAAFESLAAKDPALA